MKDPRLWILRGITIDGDGVTSLRFENAIAGVRVVTLRWNEAWRALDHFGHALMESQLSETGRSYRWPRRRKISPKTAEVKS